MPAARDGEYEARAGRRRQAGAGHGAELVAAFELPDHRLVEDGEYGRRFVLPHGYRPDGVASQGRHRGRRGALAADVPDHSDPVPVGLDEDRKSTRLNSSHANISYAVFCLKKKKK